jgi:hypothetical protein
VPKPRFCLVKRVVQKSSARCFKLSGVTLREYTRCIKLNNRKILGAV